MTKLTLETISQSTENSPLDYPWIEFNFSLSKMFEKLSQVIL